MAPSHALVHVYTYLVYTHMYVPVIQFSFNNQISMSAHRLLASVDLEPAVIMEHFMSVTVKMEQLSQESIPIPPSHVLVCTSRCCVNT